MNIFNIMKVINFFPTKTSDPAKSLEPASKHWDKTSTDTQTKALDGYFVIEMSFAKRCLDLIGAVLGILITSPLLLFIALYIKIVSPGPVFFNQKRIGKGGRLFLCYKFRTMHPNTETISHQEYLAKLIGGKEISSEEDSPMTKIEDRSQIIPFGSLIRLSGLDELPQLFNVLKGEMSLVGPRPAIPYEVDEYQLWHRLRLDVTPGITGLWQVSGKNRLSFKKMIRLDFQYARQQSLWLDVKILIKTPLAVFCQVFDHIKTRTGSSTEEGYQND